MFRLRFAASMLVVGLLTGGFLMGEDKPKPVFIKARLPIGYSKLGLSVKQKNKIYEVRATYAAQIQKLQAEIDALKEKEKSDVQSVLTAAQKARLKEIRPSAFVKEKETDEKPTTTKKK